MEIGEYIQIIWKRKGMILLFMVLMALGGIFVNYHVLKDVYCASAIVYLGGKALDINKQAEIVKSQAVKKRVLNQFGGDNPGINASAAKWDIRKIPILRDSAPERGVGVYSKPERQSLIIYYESYDPGICKKMADAYLAAYRQELLNQYPEQMRGVLREYESISHEADILVQEFSTGPELSDMDPRLVAAYGELSEIADDLHHMAHVRQMHLVQLETPDAMYIKLAEKALRPSYPMKPQKERNIAFCLILGMLFGIGAAFFLEERNNSRSEHQEAESKSRQPEHPWPINVFVRLLHKNRESFMIQLSMIMSFPKAFWERKLLVLGFVSVFGLIGYWVNYHVVSDHYLAEARIQFDNVGNEPIDEETLSYILKSHTTGFLAAKYLLEVQADKSVSDSSAITDRTMQKELIGKGLELSNRVSVSEGSNGREIIIGMMSDDPRQAFDYASAYYRAIVSQVQMYSPVIELRKRNLITKTEHVSNILTDFIASSDDAALSRNQIEKLFAAVRQVQLLAQRFNIVPLNTDGLSYPSILSVKEPKMPSTPVSPNRKRKVVLSLIIGLILGCVFAVLLHEMDEGGEAEDKIKQEKDTRIKKDF